MEKVTKLEYQLVMDMELGPAYIALIRLPLKVRLANYFQLAMQDLKGRIAEQLGWSEENVQNYFESMREL